MYIFQFNAPLYFANVGVFRSRLYIETGVNPSEFEETVVGCFKQCCTQVRFEELRVGGMEGGINRRVGEEKEGGKGRGRIEGSRRRREKEGGEKEGR